MIETAVIFTTTEHSANQQTSAPPPEPSANFAQMLTNNASQAKAQNITDNANSGVTQEESEISSINGTLADEATIQIDETTALSSNQELTPLTADQFIDQLPIQLAEVATQLRLESSHSALSDETTDQAIIEQLANNIENRAENPGLKKHPNQLATSAANSPSSEYPLANLSSILTKPDTSPSQSLLPPIQSNIPAATSITAMENTELFTPSTTNNAAIPLTSALTKPTTLLHSSAPTINSIPLTTAIDHPEWGQKFSEQIVFLSRHGSQHAELRLHPEELGSLQIQLKIFDDKAQLSVITANQQVRQVIETNLTQLRHALSEQGIELGQTHVGDHHQEQNSHEDNPALISQSSTVNKSDEQATQHPLDRSHSITQTQVTTGIDVFA